MARTPLTIRDHDGGTPLPALDYDALARYYDALVTSDHDVSFFERMCREASGPVAELMAGTGRVALPLVAAGIELDREIVQERAALRVTTTRGLNFRWR